METGRKESAPDETDVNRAERSLRHALSLARDRMAERDDVVVELGDAERGRLELLADTLKPLFDDMDAADERWDFGLSRGTKPRLWLDATTFVQMGNDRRTYRLLKDRLHDRRLLAETGELDIMADAVSSYVAERIIERRRVLDGEWEALREENGRDVPVTERGTGRAGRSGRRWWVGLLVGFLQVVLALLLVGAVVIGLLVLFPDVFDI